MAARAHGTLTSNTVTTVTVESPSTTKSLSTIWGPDSKVINDGIRAVRVSVYSTSAAHTGAAFFTVDGTAPTVSGDDTYVAIGGTIGKTVQVGGETSVVVKIISPAALAFSVEVAD